MEHRGAVESGNFDPEERSDLLLRQLGTRHEGLSEREAASRLEQHGPNEIRRREGGGQLGTLLRQFTHPLALLLWAAALLAFVGDTAPLAVAIGAVIYPERGVRLCPRAAGGEGEQGAQRLQSGTSFQLLSVPQVCQELGMGKSWVYRRIKSGEIPSVKLGHNIKVRREDLEH